MKSCCLLPRISWVGRFMFETYMWRSRHIASYSESHSAELVTKDKTAFSKRRMRSMYEWKKISKNSFCNISGFESCLYVKTENHSLDTLLRMTLVKILFVKNVVSANWLYMLLLWNGILSFPINESTFQVSRPKVLVTTLKWSVYVGLERVPFQFHLIGTADILLYSKGYVLKATITIGLVFILSSMFPIL